MLRFLCVLFVLGVVTIVNAQVRVESNARPPQATQLPADPPPTFKPQAAIDPNCAVCVAHAARKAAVYQSGCAGQAQGCAGASEGCAGRVGAGFRGPVRRAFGVFRIRGRAGCS